MGTPILYYSQYLFLLPTGIFSNARHPVAARDEGYEMQTTAGPRSCPKCLPANSGGRSLPRSGTFSLPDSAGVKKFVLSALAFPQTNRSDGRSL